MSVRLIHGRFEKLCRSRFGVSSLVFADPPDNLGLGYDGYHDRMDGGEYEVLLERWLTRCCQITDGPVFFCFNEKWTPAVEAAISTHNLYLHQRCYWHFTFGQNSKRRYTPSVRPVYWLNNSTIYPDAIKVPSARQTKYNDKRAKAGGRLPDNLTKYEIDPYDPVWEYSRVCGTFKEKRDWHVCQIPESLMGRVIKGHSLPGQTVLDPFIGSGTTARVAHRLGRNVVGIDQSRMYLEHIQNELGDEADATIQDC